MGACRIMPLLSTLAALVIIVHSAEEERDRGLERDYRYDVRPRLLDTGTPSYNQPWRDIEERRELEPSRHDTWQGQGSPEETLKRRRSLRKRKRRPILENTTPEDNPSSSEDNGKISSFPLDNDKDEDEPARDYEAGGPLQYRKTEYIDTTTVAARRRRKRPDRRNRWADDFLDVERPGRRRGTRRKRPHPPTDAIAEGSKFKLDRPLDDETENVFDKQEQFNVDFAEQPTTAIFISPQDITTEPTTTEIKIVKNSQLLQLKEDKSLSEFSLEIPSLNNNRLPSKETVVLSDIKLNEEQQNEENRPIDPMTLKEILKRSNGASLSEILQKHNLSLSDLLRGKEDALSALKSGEISSENMRLDKNSEEQSEVVNNPDDIIKQANQADTNVDNNDTVQNVEASTEKSSDLELQGTSRDTNLQKNEAKEDAPKISRRRIPTARRKLRLRPPMNGTYKGQLNRDLMALTARKYQHSRNITKSKEWKDVLPMMADRNETVVEERNDAEEADPLTTTASTDETTTLQNTEYYNPTTAEPITQTDADDNDSDDENMNDETTQTSFSTTQETTTYEATTTTEAPKPSRLKSAASRMGLRRQAFNNRMKRKRLRQKNSTTESNSDKFMIDLFGMPNLVSSSEFIARTQSPKTTNTDNEDADFTTLEDFMTTEKSKFIAENAPRFTRNSTIPYVDNDLRQTTQNLPSTTEETAKFEIEEILNDTRTSARLSRILMERNMTLNELVEHRERGSSHVHLADIFHNASKEPNPPEPFLSKSSIEPISKETYPLRAILEANLHESNAKATTIDPNPTQTQFVHIPVVMDFGNNVNENGENMGIMSLFNKFTESDISGVEKSTVGKDSEGTPYVTTVITVNNSDSEDTQRKGRNMNNNEDNLKHDIVSWNELFDLMRKNNQNTTEDEEAIPKKETESTASKVLLQDSDGDGLIVLEDLQRLKELSDLNHLTSGEKLEINSYEKVDESVQPGILDRAPSNTKSVTVATASIVGLAMILFLLTYAAFKWKQQRSLIRKKQNFSDDRIPTPVFENRKGHKNNCSTRSISPMLNTSNIYTMNTLESNTGKESPDYMWDSLRKPFQ